jgi:Bacterial regulatory protein, Fis family
MKAIWQGCSRNPAVHPAVQRGPDRQERQRSWRFTADSKQACKMEKCPPGNIMYVRNCTCRNAEIAEFPSLQVVERRTIVAALRISRGCRREAATILGISEATLYRRLKEYRQSACVPAYVRNARPHPSALLNADPALSIGTWVVKPLR